MITKGECDGCGYETVKALICEIDTELANMGLSKYNKESLYIDSDLDLSKWETLALYRAILTNKLYDCTYTNFNLTDIISKVKEHIYGK